RDEGNSKVRCGAKRISGQHSQATGIRGDPPVDRNLHREVSDQTRRRGYFIGEGFIQILLHPLYLSACSNAARHEIRNSTGSATIRSHKSRLKSCRPKTPYAPGQFWATSVKTCSRF